MKKKAIMAATAITTISAAILAAVFTKKKKDAKTVMLRQYAADICEKFEDLLAEHEVYIPDVERTGDEYEACLYGMTYSDLEDAVTMILEDLTDEIKFNPNAEIDTMVYNA